MVSSYGPSLLAPGIGPTGWARPNVPPRSPLTLANDLFTTAARPATAIAAPHRGPLAAPTQDPTSAHLGRLVDLRATQRHTVDDASLTVHTAEGDTITLTSHRETTALKARLTYAPGDAPAGAPAHGLDLREFQLDEQVTVSVQGDLSESELADLRKLVSRLGDSLHEAGDDDHEGPQPLPPVDMSGLDSLSDFSLHVEHTEDVTRLHVRRLLPESNGAASGAAAPPVRRAHDDGDGDGDHDGARPIDDDHTTAAWLLRLLESLRTPTTPQDPPQPPAADPTGPASPAVLGA